MEESDVNEAAEAQPEIEDLSDVDVGLLEADILNIVADERAKLAIQYERLRTILGNVKASISANKSVGGNEEAIKLFEKQESLISLDIQHCLRSIKGIDKKHNGVKERMQEMLERERKQNA